MTASNPLPDPSDGFELSVDKVSLLAPMIADGSLLLVDCREQDEWDFNHLPNAILVPMSRFQEAAKSLVSAGKPAIVYCHHGIRSLQATRWLRSCGLEQCWSMQGGIDSWSERIDTTVPKY